MKTKVSVVFVLIIALCLAAPTKSAAMGEEAIKLGATALFALLGERGGNQDLSQAEVEEILANNIRATLSKNGNRVSDIKLVGATSLSKKANVAFFTIKFNDIGGVCYYFIEGKKSVKSIGPGSLEHFQGFLKLDKSEKQEFLKMMFEQVAKVKIE